MEMEIETPINKMDNKEIREELESNGVILHHKTGIDKLTTTLKEVRAGTYKAPNKEAIADPIAAGSLPGSTVASRAAKALHLKGTSEQQAMKLTRVVVVPNDPNMSAYPGLIFTVGASGLNNGEMVKKYVPFNNEEGWHVPQIILNQIEHAEMQKFKTVVSPNGEKVLEPYLTKKFNVRILPDLTLAELEKLAASQQAAGFNVGANI